MGQIGQGGVAAEAIAGLAQRLRSAHESRVAIDPIRDQLPAGDLDAAYAVQQANTDHWIKQGRRLVGRKIGLTSKAVQAQRAWTSPTTACCSPTCRCATARKCRCRP